MSGAAAQNAADMAMSHEPKVATPLYEIGEKQALASSDTTGSHHGSPVVEFEADLEGEEPTPEEMLTLRRVSGKIPWTAFTIAFVELCERFGYYGCQVLCTLNSRLRFSQCSTDYSRHQLHPTATSRH
jgi:POT family proton-dependent oligopeptide transporter